MTTTQTSVTRIGFCAAKLFEANGFGLPHSVRRDAVRVLVGFHAATTWSHGGSVWVGTKTFEMNVIGKSTVKPTCCATSTVGTDSPSQIPSHDIAKANSNSSPTPATSSANPVRTVQPTTRPESMRTMRIPPLYTTSDKARPTSTAERAIGNDRK